MGKNYWFHSFKNTAWQEFHERGNARVTGFPNSRWAIVQRIQIGDCLLCYQAGDSCWIGALEVVSVPFYVKDEPLSKKDKIWHDVEFRSRVAVKVLISLSPETGVPIAQLKDRLSIFRSSNPNSWKGHLLDNPRLWSEADGKIILAALEAQHNTIIAENAVHDVISLKVEDGDEGILKGYEGEKKLILVNHYERDPALRAEAIHIHGTTCKACGFDFAKVYGSHGEGYIEVHHLRPVSSLAGRTPIHPKEDMTVLCSNCHRMIHRHPQHILTLEQLILLIRRRSHDGQGD